MNQIFKLIVNIFCYFPLIFLRFVLVDKFFGCLLSLKSRNNDHRIHIKPRLSSNTVAVNELFTHERRNKIGFI
jgi:hypothetical protein